MRYKVRHARLLADDNGTKFAMHAKNAPKRAISGEQGEFCTARAVRRGVLGEFCTGSGAVRLVQGEFCLAVTMHSGRPATVPPTRRPTDVRKTSDSQISHAIPPVQESTHAQIPQNLNDSITRSEIQSGELHATLIVDPEMRGRTPASIRGAWPGLETAHHRTALQAPPVWRAPEGPEGTGKPRTATSPARLEAAAGPAGPGRASRRGAERSEVA